jgi:hypothetical protein
MAIARRGPDGAGPSILSVQTFWKQVLQLQVWGVSGDVGVRPLGRHRHSKPFRSAGRDPNERSTELGAIRLQDLEAIHINKATMRHWRTVVSAIRPYLFPRMAPIKITSAGIRQHWLSPFDKLKTDQLLQIAAIKCSTTARAVVCVASCRC